MNCAKFKNLFMENSKFQSVSCSLSIKAKCWLYFVYQIVCYSLSSLREMLLNSYLDYSNYDLKPKYLIAYVDSFHFKFQKTLWCIFVCLI